jgi:hypothetical protein
VKSILILAASPKQLASLRVQTEEREIKERLRQAGHRNAKIETCPSARSRDIQDAILASKPQIVHFSGHGSGEQGLVFEDSQGNPKLVSTKALSGLFGLFSKEVECVVLNACYSESQATEIAKNIQYVVGMSESISDDAAIDFASGFYTALAYEDDFERAYHFGCNAIQIEEGEISESEYLIPTLFKNGLQMFPAKSNSVSSQTDEEYFNDLINSYPLLFAAKKEILDTGVLSKTIQSAMLQTNVISVEIIEKFWILFAKSVSDQQLLSISEFLIDFVDKYDICYDVVDYIVSKNIGLGDYSSFWTRAIYTKGSKKAIRYFHSFFTLISKNDSAYQSFFHLNYNFVINECYLDSLNYLLIPDRGPGQYNIDTFMEFIENSDKPEPFINRVCDWITSGLFDSMYYDDQEIKKSEGAHMLYYYLNKYIYEVGSSKFELIEKLVFKRIFNDLRSIKSQKSSRERFKIGIIHVQSMLTRGYGGIRHVQDDVLSRVYENNFSREESTLMRYIKKGCQSLHHILVSSRDFSEQMFEDKDENRVMFSKIDNYLRTATDSISEDE